MTREELEKMFDKEFSLIKDVEDYIIVDKASIIKEFMFDTIILEVIKGMLEKEESFWNIYIKQKAKEIYWIDL